MDYRSVFSHFGIIINTTTPPIERRIIEIVIPSIVAAEKTFSFPFDILSEKPSIDIGNKKNEALNPSRFIPLYTLRHNVISHILDIIYSTNPATWI